MISFESKLLIAVTFAVLLNGSLYAQDTTASAPIAFTLYASEMGKELNETQTEMAGRKITLLLDRYGYVASQDAHNFGIFPKFAVYEETQMEGLSKMLVVKGELSLVAKQVSNGLVVASCAQTVTGSGATREAALTNAISNLPTSGPQYQSFFKSVQQKVVTYYQRNCAIIIADANNKSTQLQQHALALQLLLQVPREAGECYTKAQQQLQPVFLAFQKDRCARMVQAATAESAALKYQNALSILALVDPGSPCRAEALALIQSIAPKVEARYRERLDFMLKAYSDEKELEKLRIEAYKEIAKAYYGKSDTILQALIVK
ncbi:MAG: hypothetical protein DYG98_12525 [Haliscomenobacteraceae bacterium CHB4]|nr:hypothetical protein [Saprospiraceae bacterium]MCE7923876.1 hypothetical protein [Haliscomenobacteraceae bacterium CHB4]